MQQQIKLTGKRGDSNSTKQNVMLQDSLWIGKSTVLNQLSVVTATPYEARLVAWIMEVYMAEFFCLKKATMDGLFSDDFVDYTRRFSRVITSKTKNVSDRIPTIDAVRAINTAST